MVTCVIDTSSLIILNRYYVFDKNTNKTEYEKIRTFFKKKFENKEIVVIDKVNQEGIRDIKKEFEIPDEVIEKTENVSDVLVEISNDEKNVNPKKRGTPEEIEKMKKDEREKKADLSLIAYCKNRKKKTSLKTERVVLITEETPNENHNNKLYKKIPNMCKNYDIECKNLPYLLFEIFKDQITFKISHKN